MGILYHGSSKKGIKKIEPHKSTHGNYVYATPYKELAIIFSARCGDDCTYALYRNNENEPWQIVERIPEGFNTMFSNSSSIYTLDDTTFKDIHTGFAEVVSENSVNTNSEEFLPNVYDAIKKLANEGKIKLYTYPNKPKEIPEDNSDLINKQIRQEQRKNKPISKRTFNRLILLHPNLIDKVNKEMSKLGLDTEPYKKEDLIDLFEEAVIMQSINPEKEQYLKSIVISVSKIYPELLPSLNKKLSFLDKTKEEKISYIIDKLSSEFKDVSIDLISQAKEKYFTDNRPFSEIGKEIIDFSRKIDIAEKLIKSSINQEILDNSILLIGPMGTGKSTISKKLNEITNMPRISLDDRNELQKFYQNRGNFDNFKEFEFYLTSSVLTSLKEPSIIDFGGGHSVYENPIMFYEIKKLIQKFKNVELLLPSEDINESLKIVNDRMNSRNGTGPKNAFDTNRHFIESPCNYNLATDIIYTKEMNPDEIANTIISLVENKKDVKNGSIRK